MTLFAVVWVFFVGLALAVAGIAMLAAARRTSTLPTARGPAPVQIKWQCPYCAYVFLEFEEERYVHCPQCDSLLDAAEHATRGG